MCNVKCKMGCRSQSSALSASLRWCQPEAVTAPVMVQRRRRRGVAIRGGSLWRRRRRGGGWRFVSTTVCQPAKPVAISLVHIILHSTHQPPMLMVATVILFNWKIVLLQKFSLQISCLMITKRALSTSCVCLSYLIAIVVWKIYCNWIRRGKQRNVEHLL